jgi:acyl-CoA synthetase (AMP-forming)/AMP-acid ligase II
MNDISPLTRHPDVLYGPHQPELLRDEILADLLEASARRAPEQTALIAGDRRLSYRELDELASLAASRLIEAGIRPGDIVGLWMPRGIELLVMQAAIAKAGAAWLPVDEDTPVERLLVCMEDAGSPALVSSERMGERLASSTAHPHRRKLLAPAPAGYAIQRRGKVDGSAPAYVIYTSGSTGKPKGILIDQRSICHFLRSENEVLGVRADDTVYQGFSVAFDMSFEEIWISYLVGATLWLGPKETAGDPEALPRLLNENGVTVLHAVPTLLALFAEDVPSLRIINLGGEMCPETVVERFSKPGRQMFNTYGPTEATVSASLATPPSRQADHDRPSAAELRPAGRLGTERSQGPADPAARRYRRAVHHRPRPVERLPRPPRPDRRKIPAQSLDLRPRRPAPVPHRRPRAHRRRTARWSAWAAPTTRSRSAASASSWARSRPCWRSRRHRHHRRPAAQGRWHRPPGGLPGAGRWRHRRTAGRATLRKALAESACRPTWCRAASKS